MDLPTYTNIWRIEKRLYKLYDLRLPMPLPIVWIGVFVGVMAPWALLLALLGLPFDAPWHVLYLVPPGIVTWLSTRPVIESKRLTELLQSQIRYVGEPRTWCRMAPASEPAEITLVGKVWRAAPEHPAEARGKVTRRARYGRLKRSAAPARQVRPAVAAAAAAATAPVARERPSWKAASAPRQGTAPALGRAVAVEAPPPVSPAVSPTVSPAASSTASPAPASPDVSPAPASPSAASADPDAPISADALRRLRRIAASAEAERAASPGAAPPAPPADSPAPTPPAVSERETPREAPVRGLPPGDVPESADEDAWAQHRKGQPTPSRGRPEPDEERPAPVERPPIRPIRAVRSRDDRVHPAPSPGGPAQLPSPARKPAQPPVQKPAQTPAARKPAAQTHAVSKPAQPPASKPAQPAAQTPAAQEPDRQGGRPPERQGGTPASVSIRAVPSGPATSDPVAPAVPVPRPARAETKVRRVESVVGRDSAGGWRRLAQVVIGPGGGSRTDGSEIDEARARAPFGGSRRVVVLGCTGGAGQTTTALMLGHTLARHREDRVLAVDANAGAHTLSTRVQGESPETLASLLVGLDNVHGYLGMRAYTSRCASGLEVLAADADSGAEQRLSDRALFSDRRLGQAMDVLDRHYKLVVVDPAAALAARVLPYADQLVLVVPASEDAPDAVAMTYEWLDGHGCADLRRRAVLVVNGVSRRSMGDVEQAEAVARGRCRAIVRVPWEDELAPGRTERVEPSHLRAPGRRAYLALAGVVVAGFGTAQAVRPSEEEVAQ
ncbi:hypothetical protein GCM10017673_35040 [Streptosporangium violaceochromogenes]|nr:hypothetical protein GCM10017673_35040 [Streptosporangium violaceochromogenes]